MAVDLIAPLASSAALKIQGLAGGVEVVAGVVVQRMRAGVAETGSDVIGMASLAEVQVFLIIYLLSERGLHRAD